MTFSSERAGLEESGSGCHATAARHSMGFPAVEEEKRAATEAARQGASADGGAELTSAGRTAEADKAAAVAVAREEAMRAAAEVRRCHETFRLPLTLTPPTLTLNACPNPNPGAPLPGGVAACGGARCGAGGRSAPACSRRRNGGAAGTADGQGRGGGGEGRCGRRGRPVAMLKYDLAESRIVISALIAARRRRTST